MLTRLTHSAIAFAITVVVYQAYVLFAAPFIEPPVDAPQFAQAEGDPLVELQAEHKYRELLAAYFPPGHWSLTKPPITAENDRMMLVIDELKRPVGEQTPDDGKLRVKKCAILFFPSGRVQGEPPPLDAVVLEAPQGAVLQMEQSYRGGVTSLGRVQSGKLLGQITISSDMREPGPHDDLLLTTQNVEIQEDLIYTMDQVDMRLGPHHGTGQHLEIRMVAVERSPSGTDGSSLGNIDSLVVFKDVQASLMPGNIQLNDKPSSNNTSTPPPVAITCDGSFRFDFAKQTASFFERVKLLQSHPDGLVDQVQCGNLTLYLASDTNEYSQSLGKLQARSIAAISSEQSPVIIDAPSQEASARCERIWIDLLTRQVTFDRNETHKLARPREDVSLTHKQSHIHAPLVKYVAPAPDAQQRLGDFEAHGRGWFRALTSNKPDAKPFDVSWSDQMRLRRVNGQPVLTLNGRPKLDMVGMGQLWADYLDLYLRERALDGSEDNLLPSDVVPERLVASGQIAIESEQLHGQVKQLNVQFDYVPTSLMLTSPDGDGEAGGLQLGQRQGGLKRAYDISGQTLEMLVTMRDKDAKITSIDVDGNVQFNERPSLVSNAPIDPHQQNLRVVADHLQVKNADSPAAEILLNGRPATITADGMLIRTQNLNIQRGTSRASVDAPGEIEMLVDRDLSGKALPAPQPATIRWQRSMELDRDKITFSGNVQVNTIDGTLNTHHLVVRLSAPVQFDGAASQQRLEIAELECHGGANARFTQRDAMGLTSVQTIKLEDSFFANLQSGKIRGEGPGKLESVHLSKDANPFGEAVGMGARGQLASASRQPNNQPAQQQLKFLGVQFVRGIVGNLHSRQVRVVGDVDAVYGPVDAWEQRLELTKRGMPGPDTVWINSQSLQVAESPLAKLQPNRDKGLGPIELQAEGDVTIEGPYGERGNFTTHSRVAKFDQLKNTFILEGDNRQPAKISTQEYRGGQVNPTAARRIIYHLDSRKIEVDGLMSGQFRQFTPTR